MAKIRNGINGDASGKVGNFVFSSWKGIPYVKAAPVRNAKFTPKELSNQHNLRESGKWLRPLLEYLRVGYKDYAPTVFGMNAARSYLYSHALNRETGSIDPSLMLVSYGSLGLPNTVQVDLDSEGKLSFSWSTETDPDRDPHDQGMLLAYNVEDARPVYNINGQFRKTGQDSLDLSHHHGTYHLYLAFVAPDRSRQSNSRYLGSVTIE